MFSLQLVLVLCGTFLKVTQSDAFHVLHSDGSLTHQEITQIAFISKMTQVCGLSSRHLKLTSNKHSAASVKRRCAGPSSVSLLKWPSFKRVISVASLSNVKVDVAKFYSPAHHFDDESFKDGRDLITKGVAALKVNLKNGNYMSARIHLGTVLHTLQDFYSHSNWVEQGNTVPYDALINPDLPLDNIAGPNTVTCRSCVNNDCSDNILPEILQQNILTSGYFSLAPFSKKPAGKCSHGSSADVTRKQEPTGGINKDRISSEHGFLHQQAAEVAIAATMDLLEDIQQSEGANPFLRLMGLRQTSFLAILIDISMSTDFENVKAACISILESRRGTSDEPADYILVLFNTLSFDIFLNTDKVEIFEEIIKSLPSYGGSSLPKLILSALLWTLTKAPPLSEIFIFSDPFLKDLELSFAVETMIELTQTKVTFFLTPSSLLSNNNVLEAQSGSSGTFSPSVMKLYRALASASGGLVIEATDTTWTQPSFAALLTSDTVVVLQMERHPAVAENVSFVLDQSISNVTIYITGDSPVFTLYSPSDVSQSGVVNGSLATIQTVGNVIIVKLNSGNWTGKWIIKINATSFYSLKITGKSFVDILVYFVDLFDGGLGEGWTQSFTRPQIGQRAALFVSVTGGNLVAVIDVLLVEVAGPNSVNGSITSEGGTDFLVNIDAIPEWPFVVQLTGLVNESTSLNHFQRQTASQSRGSRITITAQSQNIPMPGIHLNLNFAVATNTTSGNYSIRARTDRSFSISVAGSVNVPTGGSVQGQLTLMIPSNTKSGTDVTLTIEAEAPGSTDLNYIQLQLTVSSAEATVRRPMSYFPMFLFSFWYIDFLYYS